MQIANDSINIPVSLEEQLTCSIRRAKHNITAVSQPNQAINQNRRAANSVSQEDNISSSPAIASIVTSLQAKVADLTKNNQTKDRQITLLRQQNQQLCEEKVLITSNLEDSIKQKNRAEQHLKHFKKQRSELEGQIQKLNTEQITLQIKCQELMLKIKHLQNDKMQLERVKSKSNGADLKNEARRLILKDAQLQEKEREFKVRQEQQAVKMKNMEREFEEQIRVLQAKSFEMNREKELTSKSELKSQESTLTQRIIELQSQLEEHRKSKATVQLKETPKKQNTFRSVQSEMGKSPLKQKLKEAEHQIKDQAKSLHMTNTYVADLTQMLSEIVQTVTTLPMTRRLKQVVSRANKVLNNPKGPSFAPCTPIKSNLKPYAISSSKSKSKSHTKSGDKIRTQRSNKAQAEKERLYTYQGSRLFSAQSEELQLSELKKQYKHLVRQLDDTESQPARRRLNQIAFKIQEKTNRVTGDGKRSRGR